MHLVGIFMLISGLIALMIQVWTTKTVSDPVKKFAYINHGVGLLLVLVGGFGMLARLGLTNGLPPWIHIKLTVWVLLAAAVVVLKRKGQLGWPLYILIMALLITASYFGLFKL